MKSSVFAVAVPIVLTFAAIAAAAPIRQQEVDQQNKAFKRLWGTNLVWKFDELPSRAMLPKWRIPYAGHIWPDNAGGVTYPIYKYDRAFHRGRGLAAAYERRDIAIHQEDQTRRGGLLGLRMVTRRGTPHWAGHCNGWTAAAIRHAEPRKNVVRNGVVFTPADIKGLLAEIYVFSETEFLGGIDSAINPGTLHVVLCNWLGRGSHPIGMDTTVGKEVWNYPIYGYTSTSARRGPNQVEVKVNIGYTYMLDREVDRAPTNYRFMYLHYMLDLNDKGQIVGGRYFYDSNRIDMLWVPLRPTQGGTRGNEKGNPYINVDTVLAMWRESAPAELRDKWYVVDPAPEDRILDHQEERHGTSLGLPKPEKKPAEASETESESDSESAADAVTANGRSVNREANNSASDAAATAR